MSTKRKSSAVRHLERVSGGPLTIGSLLEAIREGEEMSQTAFAKKLGISRAHLCDLEKGRRNLSPERAARFAEKLGYSEQRFIRLSLEDQLRRAGLKYSVEVQAA